MNRRISEFLKLIRIYQWHKNGFVLLGFFLLGDYDNSGLLLRAIASAIAFSLASSAVYVFNDYRDVNVDRMHPLKKSRPLAAGTIKPGPALLGAATFAGTSLVISLHISAAVLLIMVAYFLNNILYSLLLKKYSIIDVCQIALGFMLRILAGTVGIGIFLSEWMIMTGFMVSLLLGFSKRYTELASHPNPTSQRRALEDYSVETLRAFVITMASSTIVTYALYTLSTRSIQLHHTTSTIYTTPIVIFGILRFLHLVLCNTSGADPSNLVLKDRPLGFTVLIWALAYGLTIS